LSRHLYQLKMLFSTDIKLLHNIAPLLRHDIKNGMKSIYFLLYSTRKGARHGVYAGAFARKTAS
jgi:hypothetical protein